MTTTNLVLHCGANAVERNDLFHAPVPVATRTHVPIPHHRFLQQVEAGLKYHGYGIENEAHGLLADGSRYFGLLQLRTPATDHGIIVGLRNSHDKSFPAAIAAGSQVFVCDNLAFSGQVEVTRRHTRHILRDLPNVILKAMTRLGNFYRDQEQQIVAYKEHHLTDDRARSLLVEAVKRDVIGCTHLPKVLHEWEEPSHDEFAEPTVWRLFNAVTETAKEWGMVQKMRRTMLLHGLCNAEVGLVTSA